MKKIFAEFLGTFILVFVGTGAIVVDQHSGGTIGHVGIALTFGLVVMAMIQTFGDVSGAHLNPAVSIAFVMAGRFPKRELIGYVLAQLAGALLASCVLKFLFPMSEKLGMTVPREGVGQSFLLEVILTAVLMLCIFGVSSGGKEKGITAGLTIGGVIALEALFAGPVSGASMNPARSLAPAIMSGNFQHLWLYPVATILGALLAIPLCRATRGAECCSGNQI